MQQVSEWIGLEEAKEAETSIFEKIKYKGKPLVSKNFRHAEKGNSTYSVDEARNKGGNDEVKHLYTIVLDQESVEFGRDKR